MNNYLVVFLDVFFPATQNREIIIQADSKIKAYEKAKRINNAIIKKADEMEMISSIVMIEEI